MALNIKLLKIISAQKFNMADISLEISPEVSFYDIWILDNLVSKKSQNFLSQCILNSRRCCRFMPKYCKMQTKWKGRKYFLEYLKIKPVLNFSEKCLTWMFGPVRVLSQVPLGWEDVLTPLDAQGASRCVTIPPIAHPKMAIA